MGFGKSFKKQIRKIYDATSKTTSTGGKIGRFLYPFNTQYFIRDAWRRTGKRFLSTSSPSVGFSVAGGSARSTVGNTGFHRYT